MPARDLAVVGPVGNTNVSESLLRAATDMGIDARQYDTEPAYHGPRLLRALAWHAAGHRPYRLDDFAMSLAASVVAECTRIMITLGHAPVTAAALGYVHSSGLRSINFSTDDPFNPVHRARWNLAALPHYNVVFTPRRSNIDDLVKLGCRDVRYLPFAYDERLFGNPEPNTSADDETGADMVLFVGGADRDRADFFAGYLPSGPRATLVGGYWERYAHTRSLSLGMKSAAEINALTAHAAVNLCLVRRANRDGHVMRSFEIPACAGFMIAEDTTEHRELFGPEGECVLYFTSPQDAAEKAGRALADPSARHRMAAAAHARITSGSHTYRDRLSAMLEAVPARQS